MPAQEIERSRREKIALIFEVSHCVETLGAARISGNENQVTFRGARLTPLQEMFRVHCLVILVDSEKTDVQVVARILEIVGVAAEERDRFLRCEYQTHIGVALVPVEAIPAAVVERNHVAAQ